MRKSPKLTALLLGGLIAALALPAAAKEQKLRQGSSGEVEFITPSGNIGCIYIPAGGTEVYASPDGRAELQCDRVEPDYVTVILGEKGKAKRIGDPGEQACCAITQELDYGNSWSAGPFTCLSAKSGLTCSSDAGHGFFISKAKITVH